MCCFRGLCVVCVFALRGGAAWLGLISSVLWIDELLRFVSVVVGIVFWVASFTVLVFGLSIGGVI